MKWKTKIIVMVLAMVLCTGFPAAIADSAAEMETPSQNSEGKNVELEIIDSPPTPPGDTTPTIVQSPNPDSQTMVQLSGVPTSTWTYGCTATSAGMIFGYYDRHGYADMYTGPCNNGVCPLTNLGQGTGTPIAGSCHIIATQSGHDGIWENGHVDDYWISSDSSGPDPWVGSGWFNVPSWNRTEHAWGKCTADFLGTNQWKWDYSGGDSVIDFNSDGGTAVWYAGDSSKLYDYTPSIGYGGPQTSCAHGMRLFAESRGYNLVYNTTVGEYEVYTQKVDTYASGGFTYTDFQREIDNGYPVMVQLEGHSMVGVGYDTADNSILIHDTWDNTVHKMTWGGYYPPQPDPNAMLHKGVTVIHLAPPYKGIGTSNPSQTLHIFTNTHNRGILVEAFNTGGSTPKLFHLICNNPSASDPQFWIENAATGYKWSFRTYWPNEGFALSKIGSGGAELQIVSASGASYTDVGLNLGNGRLFVDQSTGNVGIGTTNPSKTLDVNGDIIVSGSYFSSDASQGWTGTFTTHDGKTVTVKDGLITNVT